MTATLVHYIKRGHNCYDHPVITVVTVTLVHDMERCHNCYDHPNIYINQNTKFYVTKSDKNTNFMYFKQTFGSNVFLSQFRGFRHG